MRYVNFTKKKPTTQIALDRDAARWNMDAKTVQRRRLLFWEIFSSDNFHVRRSVMLKLEII